MQDAIIIKGRAFDTEDRVGRCPDHVGLIRRAASGIADAVERLFGIASLFLGLSILAALPVAQFLSLGYLFEASARVARTGRLRDGLIGVRRAARVGGVVAGTWLALLPLQVIQSFAQSAEMIDPGGRVARGWGRAVVVIAILSFLHVASAGARGGRLRFFLWPFGHPFWLVRSLRRGRLYAESRDALWQFVTSLQLPHYFRLGLIGFFGTLIWIIPPSALIAAGGRFPLLGVLGALMLALIVPFLPFLQVRFAVEGRASAFFSPGAIRDRFRRAPWAFAFALLVLLAASIPLYLLKIEMIPRESAWLPSLLFVAFLAPARLLAGWAYFRSGLRDRSRHWTLRVLGRLAILPASALYVLVVFFAQYITWGGAASLFEQHAFLLPVPFLDM